MTSDWKWTRVGLIADIVRRGVSPSYTENDGMAVVSQKCVRDALQFAPERARFTNTRLQPVPDELLLREGDSLINSTGDGTLGRVAFFPGHGRAMTLDSHVTLVRPNKNKADAKFLAYLLYENENRFIKFSQGSTKQTELSRDVVLDVPFPAISVETQYRLADYLDRETGQIDETIARIDRVVDLLEERRSSELNHTILSGVRGEATRHLKSDWIPHIAKSWSTTQLGVLGRLQTGLTLGKQWDEHTEEYPYLRVANVQVGELDLSEVKFVSLPPRVANDFTIPHSAVLMTEGGDRDKLGRGTIWKNEIAGCLHQNHVFVFECGPLLSPDFLVAYLESQYARKYFELTGTQATNLASTNSTKVKALPVPLPEISEQKEIISHLNTLNQDQREMTAAATQTKALLIERRSALITAAVTGRIEV